jgi:hypothetical protein
VGGWRVDQSQTMSTMSKTRSRVGTTVWRRHIASQFSLFHASMIILTFDRWPVIAAIIIGGLIVLSVVWCIVRCACCGLSCCCTCFSCLKCCGDCCGCCDDPRQKRHKHLDDPYFPPQSQQGYRAPAPMPLMTGAVGGATNTAYEPPKYAQFETGPTGHAVEPKKVSDDALPPMPSWETAAKKRILTEEEPESVEMGELDPATGQKVPLMSGAQPISRTASPGNSPHSPYNDRPGEHSFGSAGAMGAGAIGAGAIGAGAMAMGGRNPTDPYGRPIPTEHGEFNSAGNNRGYGPQGQAISPTGGPGRRQGFPPGPYQNAQFPQDHEQGYPGESSFGPGGVIVAGTYPRAQPQRQYSNSSDPYSPRQRQHSSDSNRPLIAPSAQRPYPSDHNPNAPFSNENQPLAYPPEPYQQNPNPRGPSQRMPSPAMTTTSSTFDFGSYGGSGNPNNHHGSNAGNDNNMGFGMGSGRRPSIGGYSSYAPSTNYAPSTAPPSYVSRSPPPQEQRGGGGGSSGYQGYKPYQAGPQPSRGLGNQRGW